MKPLKEVEDYLSERQSPTPLRLRGQRTIHDSYQPNFRPGCMRPSARWIVCVVLYLVPELEIQIIASNRDKRSRLIQPDTLAAFKNILESTSYSFPKLYTSSCNGRLFRCTYFVATTMMDRGKKSADRVLYRFSHSASIYHDVCYLAHPGPSLWISFSTLFDGSNRR